MKRLALLALASGMALAAAPAAAAPFITIDSASGTFGNPQLTCTAGQTTCSFTDTLTFTTPAGYNLASATISSAIAGNDQSTNVDFSSVTLNGVQFTNVLSGITEFRNLLNQALVQGGTNTLVISGTTGTNGSYGGSLVFAQGAVPEPATWGLMIAGFGLVGGAMRRRKTTVAYA